jgi:signal transduction histidine kinase
MQDLYFKVNLGTLYPPEASSDELKEIFAEKYNDLYEKVNSHIQYLSDTVNDFRRHMSQNTKVEKDYFNVKNFFEEIDEFIRPSIERMNIKLFNRVKLDFIEVLGVENNLKQVILNIIHNAEDIFRERNIKDREIIINAFFSEEKLNITISDNAGGIPRDVLPQIFDPYFTTKHETQGTGLGLYMSRELILKGFGGEIYATNRSHCSNCRDFCSIKSMQSEGACFTIEIPEYREI